VTWIDAQPDGNFDGLVELGVRGRLHELDRLLRRIVRGVIALCRGGVVFLSVLAHQSFTSSPIERAAPAIIAIADSTESVLRSGILISAIFLSCARVTDPDLVSVRLTRALFNPCFLLQQDGRGRRLEDEGEGFVGENRDLDRENRVLPCVRALNSLQKAMMLIPCGPRAVPTGGAGFALPAGICSLTNPVTFFAMILL
jgi:hypothetical protein